MLNHAYFGAGKRKVFVRTYSGARGGSSRYSVLDAESVEVVSPAPREVWQSIYQQDPEALVSQSPEWIDCLCSFKGYEDVSRLYRFSDGQELVIPFVKRKGLPNFLSVQSSLPYAWCEGGSVSRHPLRASHLKAVFRDLSSTPSLSMRLFPNPLYGELWEDAQPSRVHIVRRRAHIIDLEGSFDLTWAKVKSQHRSKARKAERLGVTIECDTTGRLTPVFYDLFQASVNRWANQQNEPRFLAHLRANRRDPLSKIQHIVSHMGEKYRIYIAWHAGKAVAASTVLMDKNTQGLVAVSNKELAAPVAANTLIKMKVLEDACRVSSRRYNLGETGWSQGLADFKESFGAIPYTYNEYWLERLPLHRIDEQMRGIVKRSIGFKDV